MTMWKRVILPMPMNLVCPDRWTAEWDGTTLVFEEHYDRSDGSEVAQNAVKLIETMVEVFGFETKVESLDAGLRMTVEGPGALLIMLSEVLTQLEVLSLLPAGSFEEMLRLARPRTTLPPASVPTSWLTPTDLDREARQSWKANN